MPELPEVETVRRMLEANVLGRTVARVRLSGLTLRSQPIGDLGRKLRGRTITGLRRHGKYLLIDWSRGATLISHLGMSGRWRFHRTPPTIDEPHVHARLEFADGSILWFQDPRRFGQIRVVATRTAFRDPSLAILGPDPVAEPPSGESLQALARGARVSVKSFLLDQRRIAGIGNIYASEILFRARVDPRRRAGTLRPEEWAAVAAEIPRVLGESIDRMGTTFSTFRSLWNEPGRYGERLLVYDRGGEPCRRCRTPIRRIVQAQRSTYYCPVCQGRPQGGSRKASDRGSRRR